MKMVKIGEIKLNPRNPRFIKDDKFKKLVKSLEQFPAMIHKRPIVVNEDNVILGGNMRFRAAKELGWKEIPVEVFTREEAGESYEKACDEFIIKDNSSFGEWDWNMLANEWDAVELSNWGLDIPEIKIEDSYEEEKQVNQELPTNHQCPKCGYEF